MGFAHRPVLLEEVLAHIGGARPGLIVDGTLGGAGHARALLELLPEARLIGLDRDPQAVAAARAALEPFGSRATVVHAPFAEVERVLAELGVEKVDALLADLGVSSHQLDTAERGFSFRRPGPLDMRMDPTRGQPVSELITELDEQELTEAISTLGEERQARRVARAILEHKPTTTEALAQVVRSVVRAAKDGIDPATRTFQALRILVNAELEQLERFLSAAPNLLFAGGVVAIISFHSLEDRLVKHAFREAERGCVCPPNLPACVCNKQPVLEVLTKKPVTAGERELSENPRARSAKLRVARRLGSAP